jgi:hypothetical protein
MLTALTLFHVALSLIGIGSGLAFVRNLLSSRNSKALTDVFLWTTLATSLTGFLFPVDRILPSHVVGVISIAVLLVAFAVRKHADWRRTYVFTTVLALYLNVFVLVVQLFLKVPALHELAPTGTEPPFQVAQLAVLIGFVVVGVRAAKAVSR